MLLRIYLNIFRICVGALFDDSHFLETIYSFFFFFFVKIQINFFTRHTNWAQKQCIKQNLCV